MNIKELNQAVSRSNAVECSKSALMYNRVIVDFNWFSFDRYNFNLESEVLRWVWSK